MDVKYITQDIDSIEADWLVIPVAVGMESADSLYGSEKLAELVAQLTGSGDFEPKNAATSTILMPAEFKATRLMLLGTDSGDGASTEKVTNAFMTALRSISLKETDSIAIAIPDLVSSIVSSADVAEAIGSALTVAPVGQDVYQEKPARHPFKSVSLIVPNEGETETLETGIESGRILGDAINTIRDLVNRAAHEIYPITVADRASQLATQYGLKVEIFDEPQLRAEKMNSMLAVSQGSTQPPRMVVLSYDGASESEPHTALVGKGVTFDSGGLSLKPSDSMKTMKSDMTGSATVLAAIVAAARLKLPVNIRAYLGLVENMVSGNSYKLGDVLTARNGVTIEVHNTDAEGRLVLADVLSYAADRKPARMIDLATLTGSCVVALGEEYTGAFTNNQDLVDEVKNAAESVGEYVWQMPMDASFAEQLKSDVADCKNIGTRWGGSITAAKFLEKFVDETPWVHLDIAGPSFASGSKPYRDGGATGVMLKTLVELISKTSAEK